MAEIRRILCPVDVSQISRHALDHALAIANWYDARVTAFHVFSVPQPLMPPPPGMAEDLPSSDRHNRTTLLKKYVDSVA